MSAKNEDEVRMANRYRQKRWRERNLYTARRRTREAMQHLRKGAQSVMHEAVHNEKPKVHNALEPLGELHYGLVAGYDTPMEPKTNGGPRVTEKIKETPLPETENETRTYAQLEEFKARRAQMEKGVQVELIL